MVRASTTTGVSAPDVYKRQEFDASDDAKVSDLFRFGMLMQLPYDMDKSQYYGRGPIENLSLIHI